MHQCTQTAELLTGVVLVPVQKQKKNEERQLQGLSPEERAAIVLEQQVGDGSVNHIALRSCVLQLLIPYLILTRGRSSTIRSRKSTLHSSRIIAASSSALSCDRSTY